MKFVSKVVMSLAVVLPASLVQAEVLDQWTTVDASAAHVYQSNADGSINANFWQEGAGINKESRLSLIMRLPTGEYGAYGPIFTYERWAGVIPNEFISTDGVAKATINVDTCALQASYASANACGLIDLTVTKDPLSFGSVGGGAYAYNYNGFIYQYSGAWSSHNSTAIGYVNGVAIDTAANSAFGAARATIYKSTNSSVTILTGPATN